MYMHIRSQNNSNCLMNIIPSFLRVARLIELYTGEINTIATKYVPVCIDNTLI